VTDEQRNLIVMSTQQQTEEEWYNLRRLRLTASNFGRIVKMRVTTDPVLLIRSILYSGKLVTDEIEYGKTHEKDARLQYELEKTLLFLLLDFIFIKISLGSAVARMDS